MCIEAKKAEAHYDTSACRMQWLPMAVRYCLATPVYDKDAALNQGKPERLRLDRVGEAFTDHGPNDWFVNDEKLSRRQVIGTSAFFHFRHWDDYISSGLSTSWNMDVNSLNNEIGCMVLRVRPDNVLAFESCDFVLSQKDSLTKVEYKEDKSSLRGKKAAGRPQRKGRGNQRGQVNEEQSKKLQLRRRENEKTEGHDISRRSGRKEH